MAQQFTQVVVPCYNEKHRFPQAAFRNFVGSDKDIGILFVDDGSNDGTKEILQRMVFESAGACRLFPLPNNVGKGEAIRRGIRIAMQSGADFVGFWDADLATPLEAIDDLRGVLERYSKVQIVMGSRVRLLGNKITRRPIRHYLGRLFATAASSVLSLPVYDTQCGAKLFRNTSQVEGLFARAFASRWTFDVEILARFLTEQKGSPEQMMETPLREWKDVGGSKLRAHDALRMGVDLGRIWWRYYRPGAGEIANRKQVITME